MLIGVNANRTAMLPGTLALVRWPLWTSTPLKSHRRSFDNFRRAGIEPILLLDSNSFSKADWKAQRFSKRLAAIAAVFPDAKYIEAGNEADEENGEASSYQALEDYQWMIRETINFFPNATVIAGGLVHIDFSYLDNIAPIQGFHPYAQWPDTLPDLVTEIRKHTDKDLWATEWGRPPGGDPHEVAVYHTDMLVALWELSVKAALPYRWETAGGWPGIVGTESEAAVLDAIPNLAGDPPTAPATLCDAIDVSSAQPRDLSVLIAQYQPDRVIVKLYQQIERISNANPTGAFSQDHSRAQIASAVANGCDVQGYIWLYATADPRQAVRDGVALARSCGVEPSPLWIDVELYTDGSLPTWTVIDAALDECHVQGVQPGIYSSYYMWNERGRFPDFSEHEALGWVADYRGSKPASFDGYSPFGGLDFTMWQWTSAGVDQSVYWG